MEAKKPFGRSLGDFGVLKPAEKQLLDACWAGNPVTLGDVVPPSATNENCIRAEFLRFLLLGGDEQAPVHERGVNVEGGYIEGPLKLSGTKVPVDFILTKCFFSNRIYAQDSKLGGVFILTGSHLADGLSADRLKCAGSLFLRNGLKANGTVKLPGSQIGGELDCDAGNFKDINISEINVKGSILLSSGFTAIGQVMLQGAKIGGDLDCSGGRFEADKDFSLRADDINVIGSALLSNGFKAKGEVLLQGAQIGGDLVCEGGEFEVEKGIALDASRINVGGRVSLRNGFKSNGEVNLQDARIGGSIGCEGGHITSVNGDALSLERAIVEGSVFLRNEFRANGSVNLTAAQIGSILSCDGGYFEVKEGSAIYANRLNVKGNFYIRDNFRVVGAINLKNAKIGGNLEFNNGHLESKDGVALSLSSAVVHGVFIVKDLAEPACIDASHAQVGVLDDDNLKAWGAESVLDGFRYASLGGAASTSGESRLKWLHLQQKFHLSKRDFRPQPWRQLQRVLREMGHTEDAKRVGIAYENYLRKIGRVGELPKDSVLELAWLMRTVTRGAHWVFGKLAGYGYQPVRLVIWMLGVWLACGMLYWFFALPPLNAIAPSDPLVFQNPDYQQCQPEKLDKAGNPRKLGNWYLCGDLPSEYATFSPFAYSLDVMLPVVDLGLEKTWGAYIPSPKPNWSEELFSHWTPGHVVRLITWFQILFGWVSSLLLVAIISGFSRRNDEG